MNETANPDRSAHVVWVNVVLGIWLCVSPFVLGFGRNPTEMWNNVCVGIAAVLLALISERGDGAIGGLNVPLAIWVFLSPFLLGYSSRAFLINNIQTAFFLIDAVLHPVRLIPAANDYH
jgi:hypothetical protein